MILTLLIAAGALYVCGVVRAKRRAIAIKPAAILAFCLALAVMAVALIGPIERLADVSFAWHMAQHLTLAFIVAPLLLIGAPFRIVLAALPPLRAARFARVLRSGPIVVLTHPAFALAQFTCALYVVHFSPLYEGALDHPLLHACEHAIFLTSAVIFWTPILAVSPAPHAPPHAVRLLMLFLSLPMSALLGFIFYAMRAPLYEHYATRPAALLDQSNAGALMWIAGGGPLFCALLWCIVDWGARERRLGAIADRLETT